MSDSTNSSLSINLTASRSLKIISCRTSSGELVNSVGAFWGGIFQDNQTKMVWRHRYQAQDELVTKRCFAEENRNPELDLYLSDELVTKRCFAEENRNPELDLYLSDELVTKRCFAEENRNPELDLYVSNEAKWSSASEAKLTEFDEEGSQLNPCSSIRLRWLSKLNNLCIILTQKNLRLSMKQTGMI